MFISRFIVAMFLLSAAYNVLGASIATADDDELAEKFEKVADLDEPSKSLNETTTSAIKVRDVTTELTQLKANVTVSATNSTGNATSSVKSTKQDSEKVTPKVVPVCKMTTCSVKNRVTTCKTTTNCISANLKTETTTEKVTTPKVPALDDDEESTKQD
ncbi:uncharacterized protein LOC124203775 [Daphnia pulex]|uniref:uncharacterized protein LOC124203775 n=1 Tax=Daphnia pulex TaxID=6669 RepID=UPI001EE14368|nr:uncharacterized protein LOC124203775 [Daphnia pulex]